MKGKRTLLHLLAISFVLFFFVTNTTHALTVTPIRFELSGNPGETVTKEMTLINEQGDDKTFYASFANFEAQGDTGNPAFGDPVDDIGSWLRTDDSVTIPAGTSKIISFHILIPEDATPGGHFGAIFWGTSPDNVGGGQVGVTAKTGLLVLLSVNGDVKEAGGVNDFDTKDGKFWYNSLPVSFLYRFKNDGGDRIKPSGKITIRNTVYLPSARLNANPVEGNILPNSTRKFEIEWLKYARPKNAVPPNGVVASFFDTVQYQWKNFAFGLYGAHLDLSYGTKGGTAKDVVYFFVFPWQLLLIMFILLIIIFFGGRKLLKQYNRYVIRKAHSQMRTSA